jgi:hypothetical protein
VRWLVYRVCRTNARLSRNSFDRVSFPAGHPLPNVTAGGVFIVNLKRPPREEFVAIAPTITKRQAQARWGIGRAALRRYEWFYGVQCISENAGYRQVLTGEKYIAMCDAGMTRNEIMAETGLGRTTLQIYAKRYSRKPKADPRNVRSGLRVSRDEYLAMVNSGMNRQQICDEIGIAYASLDYYIQAYGERPERKPIARALSKDEFARLAPHHTIKEIAEISGLSVTRVSQLGKDYEIVCKPAARKPRAPKAKKPKVAKAKGQGNFGPRPRRATDKEIRVIKSVPAGKGKPSTWKPKAEHRADISADVERFLASGGTVKPLPGVGQGRLVVPARAHGMWREG